jgi:hypothetical protein
MNTSKALRLEPRAQPGLTPGQPTALPLTSFRSYYLGTIIRPRRTFAALLADDRRLRHGLLALALNAALYTLIYAFLWHGGGAPSSFTPWLAIPKDVYYAYNRFLLAPSMVAGWMLAAGVAQLLSRPFGGKGSFEDTLSVFGFGISIACLASLAHDLPDSLLGAIGLLNLREYEVVLNTPMTIGWAILWTCYSLSFLWFLVLFPKGVAAAQRIGRGPAVLVGVLSFAVYQFVFLIFNR